MKMLSCSNMPLLYRLLLQCELKFGLASWQSFPG